MAADKQAGVVEWTAAGQKTGFKDPLAWMDESLGPDIKRVKRIFHELDCHMRAGLGVDPAWNARTPMLMEALATAVRDDSRPPFTSSFFRTGLTTVKATPLGSCLQAIGWPPTTVEGVAEWSPYIQVVSKVLSGVERYTRPHLHFSTSRAEGGAWPLTEAGITFFKELLEHLRQALQEPGVRKEVNQKTSRANERYRDACSYMDSLFKEKDDLAVVSIQLLTGRFVNDQASKEIVAKECSTLKAAFLKGVSGRAMQSGMVGYMGRWAYSAIKGVHAQMLVFADAKTVSDDVALAERIGQYWVNEITAEAGAYLNVLFGPEVALYKSVVHVNKRDKALIKELKESTVFYLASIDKYFIPPQLGMKERFFRGEIKKKRKASTKRISGKKAAVAEGKNISEEPVDKAAVMSQLPKVVPAIRKQILRPEIVVRKTRSYIKRSEPDAEGKDATDQAANER
jgi:hypothetical protein